MKFIFNFFNRLFYFSGAFMMYAAEIILYHIRCHDRLADFLVIRLSAVFGGAVKMADRVVREMMGL